MPSVANTKISPATTRTPRDLLFFPATSSEPPRPIITQPFDNMKGQQRRPPFQPTREAPKQPQFCSLKVRRHHIIQEAWFPKPPLSNRPRPPSKICAPRKSPNSNEQTQPESTATQILLESEPPRGRNRQVARLVISARIATTCYSRSQRVSRQIDRLQQLDKKNRRTDLTIWKHRLTNWICSYWLTIS